MSQEKAIARQVEIMCDRIEATFARHKVSAHVTGGKVAISFLVDVNRAPGGLGDLAGELCAALGAEQCAIQSDDGGRRLRITVE